MALMNQLRDSLTGNNPSSVSSSSSSPNSSSSSSSSSSALSSSSSSSSKPIFQPEPFPYENERSYTVNWNLLSLPDGFPRLTDYVTEYAIFDTDNGNNRKFVLYWNIMPEYEMNEITNKVCEWLENSTQKNITEMNPSTCVRNLIIPITRSQ